MIFTVKKKREVQFLNNSYQLSHKFEIILAPDKAQKRLPTPVAELVLLSSQSTLKSETKFIFDNSMLRQINLEKSKRSRPLRVMKRSLLPQGRCNDTDVWKFCV